MNQTAPSALDKKGAQTGTVLRGTGTDGTQAQLEFNPYAEDPRPNLFNIIKNIRDNKVKYNDYKMLGCIHESIIRCKD
jgi:hypothetical protein